MLFDRDTIYGCVRTGKTRAEAAVLQGEPLTADQKTWWVEASLVLKEEKKAARLAKAKAAQAAARKRREEEEKEAKANLDRWMQPLRDAAKERRENGQTPPGQKKPLTSTERARLFRERGRDLGDIPPPADPWRRMMCTYSPLRFGLTYCTDSPEGVAPLLVRPPSARMENFIYAFQRVVFFGGMKHVRWPRGKGKTTWMKIVVMWAICYGHKRFPVIVEKVKSMGREFVEEIWNRIRLSPKLAADFPELAVPMNDVAFTPQRMRAQTFRGRSTRMKMDIVFGYYRLPTMTGFPNTGAIIAYRGSDQAIRGLNIDSSRPDLILIDDPQSDADAANQQTVSKIEDNINGSDLGLGKTSERISAVMCSTPIEPDDVSERFADPARHPEWNTETEKLVRRWGDESLREEYLTLLAADDARGDANHTRSAAFYAEHRADIERGVEMMDDGDFDRATEVSAYQHALWLLHTMKKKRFVSEMQMEPRRDESVVNITPRLILERVNKSVTAATPPDGTVLVCLATDINPSYALSCVAVAYDSLLTGTVIDHWLHPCRVPGDANDTEFHTAIYNLIAEVAASLPARGYDPTARDFAWGVDCSGQQFKPVCRYCLDRRRDKTANVYALRGQDNRTFNPRVSTRKFKGVPGRNDTVLCFDPATGYEHINFNKDKYEYAAHRAWLSAVGAPGGLSLYATRGGAPASHEEFALQVCGEQLKWKPADPDRDRVGFKWDDRIYPRHDLGDCVYMTRALAGFLGLASEGGSPSVAAPRKRRAIVGGRVV